MPQDFGRVLVNLYNNAFYAAEEFNPSETTDSSSATRPRNDKGEKCGMTTKDVLLFFRVGGEITKEWSTTPVIPINPINPGSDIVAYLYSRFLVRFAVSE
jgi:hypothetical protein